MQPLLTGMRIVEGSAFIAAPMCGMTLAQLGADVIRFDQIGGGLDYRRWPVTKDNVSIYWAEMNKGKRSFAVDLRSDRGRELVTQLICAGGDGSGIFSTNLPARGWLSYESLKRHRDDLIQLAIIGDRHGATAVDYTVNSRVGFPTMTGYPDDDRPINHILPAWDNITAYQAALSLLAADRHRRLTGQGQYVEIALADVALATMGHLGFIGEVMVNDVERPRVGTDIYGSYGRDVLTADNVRVMVVSVSPRQWRGLLAATHSTDAIGELAARRGLNFDREGDRYAARDDITAILQTWVGRHIYDDVARAFDSSGVCWGRFQTVRELVRDDPDVSTDNPIFDMVDQPDIGRYLVPGQPMSFSAVERAPATPAPRLGEHTDEILAEDLGLTSAEIGILHDQGVVAKSR